MNPALRKLLRKGDPTPEEIDKFLQSTEFPLVSENDVTFVYRGHADAVYLRCFISGLDAAQPLQALGESGLWAATLELSRGSRIEYKFEIVNGDHRELVVDPLNPVLARDPFGANSVCQAAGYERPAWTEPQHHTRKGSVEGFSIDSKAFGQRRDIAVYLPARFKQRRRYPLLIVHDGFDYLKFAALQTVLDNLIDALEIPPLIAALTQSPDRLKEYAGDDRHAEFVAKEIPKALADHYLLAEGPWAPRLIGGKLRWRGFITHGLAVSRGIWSTAPAIGLVCFQRYRAPPT